LALYRVAPSWSLLWLIPVLLLLVAFTVGLCLLLSAIVVLYRDVRFTLPLLTQLWLFVTPILYPVSVVPSAAQALYLSLNPLAALIEAFREVTLEGAAPVGLPLLSASGATLLTLGLGYTCFKKLERRFADVI